MKKLLYAGFLSFVLASTAQVSRAEGQDIKSESGGMFMEETTPTPPVVPKKNIPIDLSNVGVPVDPSGHIVPMIDRNAPGGVRQNYSNLEVYSEPAYNFIPAPLFNQFGQPYNFSGVPGVPYGGPYPYGGFGGYRGYGGFGGYGGYPYNSGIGINLGRNFRLNLATPNPYGYGPYGGFGGGFSGGFGSPFGSPYGYNVPFGGGFAGATPFGVPGAGSGFGAPFGTPGIGFGGPFGGGPFGYGNPYGATPLLYSSPFGYGSPYGGSSLFSTQTRGLGLNLFVPNNVEWQSSSTFTPLTPNLNGPP